MLQHKVRLTNVLEETDFIVSISSLRFGFCLRRYYLVMFGRSYSSWVDVGENIIKHLTSLNKN